TNDLSVLVTSENTIHCFETSNEFVPDDFPIHKLHLVIQIDNAFFGFGAGCNTLILSKCTKLNCCFGSIRIVLDFMTLIQTEISLSPGAEDAEQILLATNMRQCFNV